MVALVSVENRNNHVRSEQTHLVSRKWSLYRIPKRKAKFCMSVSVQPHVSHVSFGQMNEEIINFSTQEPSKIWHISLRRFSYIMQLTLSFKEDLAIVLCQIISGYRLHPISLFHSVQNLTVLNRLLASPSYIT